jgi:vacuolar iron transporter family protein
VQVYFISGALVPTIALLLPDHLRFWGVVLAVTMGLAIFGAVAARLGGTRAVVGSTRLVVGGWLAMLCTTGIGHLFGVDDTA